MTLLKSWVESANSATTDFPLNNLPCGVFSTGDEQPRCGVAIGDYILDISALEAEGLLKLIDQPLFDVPFWNELMEAGPAVWADFRTQVTAMLAVGASKRWIVEDHLVQVEEGAHFRRRARRLHGCRARRRARVARGARSGSE